MAHYMVISADCHAGLPAPLYRPYLEKKYHDDFGLYLEELARFSFADPREVLIGSHYVVVVLHIWSQ